MKTVRIIGVLAAVLVVTPAPSRASPASANPGICDANAGDIVERIDAGSLAARQCAVNIIERQGRPSNPTSGSAHGGLVGLPGVADGVAKLQAYYVQRAHRQQTIMDLQAGMVVLLSLGAAAASGTPASTQRIWAYSAFAPVINSQINANEPTRNLYHGGALGLGLINERYDRISQLSPHAPATDPALCSDTERKKLVDLSADIRRWGTTGASAGMADGELTAAREDRTALLKDADRLIETCDTLRERHAGAGEFRGALDVAVGRLAAGLSQDALALDQALLERDRGLRASPAETVGAIIASPLRTLDTILTGNSAQTAVNALKTQAAFAGLNQALSPIRLPAAPLAIASPQEISAESRLRSGASGRTSGHSDAFSKAFADLNDQRNWLAGRVSRWNRLAATLADIAAAGQADTLRFQYDPLTGSVDITLGADAAVRRTEAPKAGDTGPLILPATPQ